MTDEKFPEAERIMAAGPAYARYPGDQLKVEGILAEDPWKTGIFGTFLVRGTGRSHSGEWGYVIEYRTRDDVCHRLIFPATDLLDNGRELMESLAKSGFWMDFTEKTPELIVRFIVASPSDSYFSGIKFGHRFLRSGYEIGIPENMTHKLKDK